MKLDHSTFFSKDFSKLDLKNADLSHSEFTCCNFNGADLSGAKATHSKFTAGSMVKTKCTNTDFSHSKLALRFEPSDCFGMTLTLQCSTFRGMTVSRNWWYGWLYFAMMMVPSTQPDGKDIRDEVVQAIGPARYLKLKGLFSTREI